MSSPAGSSTIFTIPFVISGQTPDGKAMERSERQSKPRCRHTIGVQVVSWSICERLRLGLGRHHRVVMALSRDSRKSRLVSIAVSRHMQTKVGMRTNVSNMGRHSPVAILLACQLQLCYTFCDVLLFAQHHTDIWNLYSYLFQIAPELRLLRLQTRVKP